MNKEQIEQGLFKLQRHFGDKFIVCGSSALVLCGFLNREVNDIDVIIKEEDVNMFDEFRLKIDKVVTVDDIWGDVEFKENPDSYNDFISFDFDEIAVKGFKIVVDGIPVDVFYKDVTIKTSIYVMPTSNRQYRIQDTAECLKAKMQVMLHLSAENNDKYLKHKKDFEEMFDNLLT